MRKNFVHKSLQDGVIGAVLLSAPDWVTEATLSAIWEVLAKYSTLMANAK